MQDGNESDLLTTGEVGRMLRVSPDTVLAMIRRGELPAVQLGGARPRHRVYRRDLTAYLSRRYSAPGSAVPERERSVAPEPARGRAREAPPLDPTSRTA